MSIFEDNTDELSIYSEFSTELMENVKKQVENQFSNLCQKFSINNNDLYGKSISLFPSIVENQSIQTENSVFKVKSVEDNNTFIKKPSFRRKTCVLGEDSTEIIISSFEDSPRTAKSAKSALPFISPLKSKQKTKISYNNQYLNVETQENESSKNNQSEYSVLANM